MGEAQNLSTLDTPAGALHIARASIAPGVWFGVEYGIGTFEFWANAFRNGAGIDLSPEALARVIAPIIAVVVLTGFAWFAVSRVAGTLLVIGALAELALAFRGGVFLSIFSVAGLISVALGLAGIRGAFAWHKLRRALKMGVA